MNTQRATNGGLQRFSDDKLCLLLMEVAAVVNVIDESTPQSLTAI